jgi:HAD superfamily hydrolase (TIGR01509 family)
MNQLLIKINKEKGGNMKYKAIIFDMDGTIVDTEHIWASATKDLIASKGVLVTPELEQELSKKLRGLAMFKSCEIIKDMINVKDSVEDLISEKSRLACLMYKANKLKFIEGFENFHNEITNLNLKTGIATNADDLTLELTKQALNLEKFFGNHIYNITHVGNKHKPNPDLYLHAAKQLNLKPSECLAIEDSHHGIKAAKNAGMFCIGINTAQNKDLLKESDLIIDKYSEIDLKKLLGIE